ncbi:endonuclease/exonuclease/phosphatase family protein [Sphingobacterium alkalisoli]|uniref:Endonuclease/exonuclease/phosphatase family protein n=1 Tax=Sphingobacterium alkalisoli TaxID=1874115 RepID=A0A4U0H0E5_9SPHI|nr:endonuclease/exonuclease/phosphatase family protein [Sphingobacterium alkalisoli]TJY64474.1 endonuclease/exonuclease/phosphatase family protein [Sphingobacterium alkalisoli]GGH21531.1 endonuclease [Sphingobacterium alkalisoli]
MKLNKPTLMMYAILIALVGISCQSASRRQSSKAESLRIMTFNLWHGGDAVKLPRDTTIKYQLEAIRKAEADVVGFQEQTTNQSDGQSRAKILADSLGWQCHLIDGSRAIISRFGIQPFDANSQAVLLSMANGGEIVFGVMHLMYTPYEPYDIADGKLLTAEAAETSARKARLHQVQSMLDEIAPHKDHPIVLVGDFNEPSCLDWTAEAIRERADTLLPFAVNWPATELLIQNGFKDVYREVHPEVKARPGYTWTSVEGLWRTPEIHDRIDLIYVSKNGISTKGAWVVGEPSDLSDIVVHPWPSDHRAVVVALEITK